MEKADMLFFRPRGSEWDQQSFSFPPPPQKKKKKKKRGGGGGGFPIVKTGTA